MLVTKAWSMICPLLKSKHYLARFLAFALLLTFSLREAWAEEEEGADSAESATESTLVRVNIITETLGASEAVVVNGRRIPEYRPKIIQIFPSTGIVIDDMGHILTFLGYRWVDVQAGKRRIEILTSHGLKHPARLVGIDQTMGVAIVVAPEAKLKKTPLCESCEIRDGATVVMPVLDGPGRSQFERAQIVSAGSGGGAIRGGWQILVNRQVQGIGQPLLNARHRVLGFIASQKPSAQDPGGMDNVVYPLKQLLTSAARILEAGGDVRTGWLGIFLDDAPASSGVRIKGVKDGSPARKAGLAPDDVLVKWNGTTIRDYRQFIQLVQDTRAGAKVVMDVVRRGTPMSVTAVIENRSPESSPGNFVFSFPGEISLLDPLIHEDIPRRSRIGLEVIALSPQLAESLRLPGHIGLLVCNVEASRPAALAGVQVGDIILSVDGQQILDPQMFTGLVQTRGRNGTLVLKLLRKGSERSATVQLKASK